MTGIRTVFYWGAIENRLIMFTGDVEVTVDEIAVHVNSDGSLDESKTDLYIHAIRDNTSQIVEVCYFAI